jgi:hypothetical protein
MRKGKMMFDTAEELQAHYKAVKKRIEAKKPPTPKPQAIEPPKPLALPDNPVLIHRIRQRYKIENYAFIKVDRLGVDKLTYQQVIHIVCREFDITPLLLFGRRRTNPAFVLGHRSRDVSAFELAADRESLLRLRSYQRVAWHLEG